MSRLKHIFLHCSDSPWGDVLIIDQWHRARGWKHIGYHFVILNGRPHQDMEYWSLFDGVRQPGHRLDGDPIFELDEIGTHVAGRNAESIGICLIGRREFTDRQLAEARSLVRTLLNQFDLPLDAVKGHYEDPSAQGKTCPNIPMHAFREFVRDNIDICKMQTAIGEYTNALFGKKY